MKRNRGWLGYLIVLAPLLVIALLLNGSMMGQPSREITYAQLWEMIDAGQVKTVAIRENNLWGLKVGTEIPEAKFPEIEYDFETTITDIESFRQEAYKRQAKVLGVSPDSVGDGDLTFTIVPMAPETVSVWVTIIPYLLMIGSTFLILFFIMRAQGGGNGKVMNFGKDAEETVIVSIATAEHDEDEVNAVPVDDGTADEGSDLPEETAE